VVNHALVLYVCVESGDHKFSCGRLGGLLTEPRARSGPYEQ
jgi:hypothetical protein